MLLIESLMVSVIFTVSKDSCSPFPFLFLVQILLLAAFFLPPLGSYRVTYVKRQRLVLQSPVKLGRAKTKEFQTRGRVLLR